MIDNHSFNDAVKNLYLQANARSLCEFYKAHADATRRNIFFQCPWHFGEATAALIEEFFSSAAERQEPGDRVLLGLVNMYYYHQRYNIDNIHKTAKSLNYSCAEDRDFTVNYCISHGYRHHSDTHKPNNHDYFKQHHVTYVFTKVRIKSLTQRSGL